ncbi:MAG: hypothetical protein ACHQ1G_10580 [Planctomycetota bacterium]
MTEDPVKLYVIVMAILLCVLSYVAYDSWKQASAFEAAIERAPQEAEQMRVLASDVKALVDQLAKSGLRDGGERVLVERVKNSMGIAHSGFNTDPAPIGAGIKGRERRVKVDFGGGRSSPPLSRQQVYKFCEAVERDSSGIVKTIEIKLNRASGEGMPDPGKEEKVTLDKYKGTIIFGLRVVE